MIKQLLRVLLSFLSAIFILLFLAVGCLAMGGCGVASFIALFNVWIYESPIVIFILGMGGVAFLAIEAFMGAIFFISLKNVLQAIYALINQGLFTLDNFSKIIINLPACYVVALYFNDKLTQDIIDALLNFEGNLHMVTTQLTMLKKVSILTSKNVASLDKIFG